MSSAALREVVGDLLKNTWSNTGNVPIAWPNRKFDPPENSTWIRVSVVEGESRQLTLGASTNMHRAVGVLYVQVFTPVNTGDYEARRLADEISTVFRASSFDGAVGEVVRFRSPSVRPVGSDGVYYQVNCEVPFVKDMIV